jgi:hypothetical protein
MLVLYKISVQGIKMPTPEEYGLAFGIAIPFALLTAWGLSIGEDGDPDIFGLFKRKHRSHRVVNYSTGEDVSKSHRSKSSRSATRKSKRKD